MFLHIFEAKIEHERKKAMPKIDQFPGPVEEYLVTNKKTEEEKRSTADFPCEGHWLHTIDGDDFDCEYEFAGDITCDECKINGGPYDPRFPREPDDEL